MLQWRQLLRSLPLPANLPHLLVSLRFLPCHLPPCLPLAPRVWPTPVPLPLPLVNKHHPPPSCDLRARPCGCRVAQSRRRVEACHRAKGVHRGNHRLRQRALLLRWPRPHLRLPQRLPPPRPAPHYPCRCRASPRGSTPYRPSTIRPSAPRRRLSSGPSRRRM